MEKNEIIQQLKKLRDVEPGSGFVVSLRRGILAMPQERARRWFMSWKPMVMGAAALVLIVSFGLYIWNFVSYQGSGVASLDIGNISEELGEFTISIELEEIEYNRQVNRTIVSALNEISNDSIRHLSRDVLEIEESGLDIDDSTEDYINELLDTIMF